MQKLRVALATLVTLVWFVGYVNSYVRATGDAPTELTALMVVVLGWAFSGQVKDVIAKKIRDTIVPDDPEEKDPDA